jgi:hypothetical protein
LCLYSAYTSSNLRLLLGVLYQKLFQRNLDFLETPRAVNGEGEQIRLPAAIVAVMLQILADDVFESRIGHFKVMAVERVF